MSLNMQVLKRSRKRVLVGDIFALKVLSDRFHFGRVICTDAKIGNIENTILIYIYRATSADKTVVPAISLCELLLPPVGTTRHLWSRGYFENVANLPLTSADVLAQHCFERYSNRGAYFDEYGHQLAQRSDPCGGFALTLDGALDDMLSDALGISRCAESIEYDKARVKRLEKAKLRHDRTVRQMSMTEQGRALLRQMGIEPDSDAKP